MSIERNEARNAEISELREHLKSLAQNQRRSFKGEPGLTVETPTRKQMLSEFKDARVFKRFYGELVNFASLPISEDKFQEAKSRFLGAVFANLAFSHMVSERQVESRIVLSPQRTLDFYGRLHPQAERVKHPFGESSLKGISVPDGIEVDSDGKVVGICEYTVHGDPEYFVNKFRAIRYEKELYPEMFSQAQLVVVMPSAFRLSLRRDIRRVELPFGHDQFRDFIDGIVNHYRTDIENSATISEIRRESTFQLRRAIGTESAGTMTVEQRKYLERVRQRL